MRLRVAGLVVDGESQKLPVQLFADCIDQHVEVANVRYSDISKAEPSEASEKIRERVIKARKIQEERFKNVKDVHCNAQMNDRMIHKYAEPDEAGLQTLRIAMERLSLSARAYSRILKVARTIADLDGSENVRVDHIAEAISYRNLARSV